MHIIKLTALACSLLVMSCANSTEGVSGSTAGTGNGAAASVAKDGFTIKGKLRNQSGGKVLLEELGPQNFIVKDTASVAADGSFSFTGKVNEPTIYRLNVPEKGEIMLVLENKEVQIEADANDQFAKPQFKGSKESENMQGLNAIIKPLQKRANELNQQYAAAQGNTATMREIEAEFTRMQTQANRDIKQFIRSRPGSVIGVYATANMLNQEQDMAFADSMGAVYKKNLPNSQYTRQLEAKLNQPRPLGIGSVAPDIKLASPEGKEIALSSLRGKYVLIDFWASWCGPCRKENPNVVRLYNEYKGKNFEIFGVSLDQSKEKWVQAIAADQLTWPHVSDLKGWQSSAAQLYGVNSIPATFLIDPQGKIVAKNLRGHALEQKVAELVKK